MAFVGVEFNEECNGELALVHSSWLTPFKKEVFWPPFKTQEQYEKALRKGDPPSEGKWKLYTISRKFFECDDYHKAKSKLRQAEETSDIQSEIDTQVVESQRRRLPPRKLYDSSDDENISNNNLPRPPLLKNSVLNSNSSSKHKDTSLERLVVNERQTITTTKDTQVNEGLAHRNVDKAEYPVPMNKLIAFLVEIKEQNNAIIQQNNHILNYLNKGYNLSKQLSQFLPDNFPIVLPVDAEKDLTTLENYIADKENSAHFASYLSTLGGRDVIGKVNNILKHCITNKLATLFSFLGKRNKRAFNDLQLRSVVICAIKIAAPEATEKEIENAVKVWLKHSPQRYKTELQKLRSHEESSEKISGATSNVP